MRRRKAIRPLIEASTHDSAELRFWCVFALGHYLSCSFGRRRAPLAVVRALEARLQDHESPEGNWWPVRLEALAALRNLGDRHSSSKLFRGSMLSILTDPLSHRDQWQWATCYVTADSFPQFDVAVQAIHDAGFGPVEFGREPRSA
jgi:hypothetical protein